MWMLILDVLMRENDPVSFQMFPGIDCKRPKSLNLSVIQNLIATFYQKFGASNVSFMRPLDCMYPPFKLANVMYTKRRWRRQDNMERISIIKPWWRPLSHFWKIAIILRFHAIFIFGWTWTFLVQICGPETESTQKPNGHDPIIFYFIWFILYLCE